MSSYSLIYSLGLSTSYVYSQPHSVVICSRLLSTLTQHFPITSCDPLLLSVSFIRACSTLASPSFADSSLPTSYPHHHLSLSHPPTTYSNPSPLQAPTPTQQHNRKLGNNTCTRRNYLTLRDLAKLISMLVARPLTPRGVSAEGISLLQGRRVQAVHRFLEALPCDGKQFDFSDYYDA